MWGIISPRHITGHPSPSTPSHLFVELHQGLGLLSLVEGEVPEQQIPWGRGSAVSGDCATVWHPGRGTQCHTARARQTEGSGAAMRRRCRKPPEPREGSKRRFLPRTVSARGSNRAGKTGGGQHPAPLQPHSPHSPIFCAKILSNVTSPRSSRYFCMTLRMLGGSRGSVSAHCSPPYPCAPRQYLGRQRVRDRGTVGLRAAGTPGPGPAAPARRHSPGLWQQDPFAGAGGGRGPALLHGHQVAHIGQHSL